MSSSNKNPKWWLLYLTFLFSVALLAVDSRLKISTGGHQAVEIGIILLVCGLVHLWLNANASALSRMDQRQYYGTMRVIRIPSAQLSDHGDDKGPMFQLPDSEIKDVLHAAFEMDTIDAKSLRRNKSCRN
jgi:hypothetical protein